MKVFRHLRERLLAENRITRYLLYAIGEIALVVIGILIAVAIDDRNDFKADRLKECEYLRSLQAEISSEYEFLANYSLFDKEVVRNGDSLIQNFYDRGRFTVDTAFSKQVSILNNRNTFRKYNTTYQELLSNAGLNLILDNELKQEIMKHYQTVDQFEVIIRQNNEYVDTHFAPMVLKKSTHYMPKHQISLHQKILKKGYIRADFDRDPGEERLYFRDIQMKLEDPLIRLELLNQLQYRYRISAVHLSIVDELMDQNRKLSDLLRDALRSCPSSNSISM